MEQVLYLIAIMPPPDIAAIVRDIQQDVADKYHTKAALKIPPHITVIPPFRLEAEQVALLSQKLAGWAVQQSAFNLSASGFSSFEKNRVLFISIAPSARLNKLHDVVQQELQTLFPQNISIDLRPYRPHFTVGYRDLSAEHFKQAAAVYRTRAVDFIFPVDRLFLWRHNGRHWAVIGEFAFSGDIEE